MDRWKGVAESQPSEPDNFQSSKQESTESTESAAPKVMTVASAATHLSGGPVSAVHESTDSANQDEQQIEHKDDKSKKDSSEAQLVNAGAALAHAVNSVVRARNTLGEFGSSFVPDIKLPKAARGGKGGKGAEFKPSGKPLDADEKRGAWILAGVVGLGLLLGGPKSDKNKKSLKDKAEEAADKVKGAVGASSGVKGDEKWAKASGAEVVGHGTRKA